jgi:hypothetical protein
LIETTSSKWILTRNKMAANDVLTLESAAFAIGVNRDKTPKPTALEIMARRASS